MEGEDTEVEKVIAFQEEEEDPDFEGGDVSQEEVSNISMFSINLSVKDTIMVSMVLSDQTTKDVLGEITEINHRDENLQLKTDTNDILNLVYTSDNVIVPQTETYELREIYLVESFAYDDLDTQTLMLTKDLYSDIQLLVKELDSNKVYSLYEQKQSILTELISLLNAQGDESKIHSIYEIVDSFQSIIQRKKDSYSDNRDIFPFVKEIIHNQIFNLPRWFLPITNMKKRLFLTEEEDQTLYPDVTIQTFEEYLDSYESSIDIETVPNYKQLMHNVYSYKPYQPNSEVNSVRYEGHHIRNCNERNQCNGIRGQYYPDIIKTNHSLSIPISGDKSSVLEIIAQKELIDISGFYSFPVSLFSYTLSPRVFSLYEHFLLGDLKSSSERLTTKFNNEQIIPNIVGKDTANISLPKHTELHSYLFNDKIPKKDIGKILKDNLPTISELISGYPPSLIKQIYSHKDFELLFSNYQLTIQDLSPEKRIEMKETIRKNIQNYIRDYNKSVKWKVIKQLKKQVNVLSDSDKIRLSKQYVNTLTTIPLRNQYTKKIIDRFSRKATPSENSNYLYEKHSSEKLFCTHYEYSCGTHKDPELFKTMKSLFGAPPVDGIISCQVCGEYLCHEEFTTFQGYGDGAVTLETAVEDDSVDLFTKEQQDIMNRIKKVNSFLSVELTMYDIKQTTLYLELLTHTDYMNLRYKKIDAFKQHPRHQQIMEEFPVISKPSTSQEKKQNKRNSQKRNQSLKQLKSYLEDCTHFLLITCLSLFFLQTSIPPYVSSIKQQLRLIEPFQSGDTWSSISDSMNELISVSTIDRLFIQIESYSNRVKDPFWDHISTFLKESDIYEEIESFKEQFSKSLSYIMKNEKFKQSFKLYFEYEQTSIRNIFVKESWPSYKPQKDNFLVESMNQIIQQELINTPIKESLLKQKGSYLYENISSIVSLQSSQETPRYRSLNIPDSSIMRNESYQRLFNYSIHLHGKTQGPMYPINLHIQQFLQTTDYSEEIKTLFESYGWNSETKQMSSINYSDLRKLVIQDTINLFKDKDPSNQKTLDTFIHIGLNNWNGMLLNGNPKRNYSYEEPIIYPISDFTDILEESPQLIQSLFKQFCLDEDNDIQYRYSNDDFITNLVADPMIEREIICQKSLDVNQESFDKILDFKRTSKKHIVQIIPDETISDILKNRISHMIEHNELLKGNSTELFPIFQQLSNVSQLPQDQQDNEWQIIISSLISLNESMKDSIQTFYLDHQSMLRSEQIQRYNSLFGRSLDSLNIMLSKLLDKDRNIHNSLTMVHRIIGRLSHKREQRGTIFHTNIPKQWKLSDTNVNYFKEFLSMNEFLLHNDLFIINKKSIGFNYYQTESSYHLCFKKLLETLPKIKDLETIIKYDKSLLTEEYSRVIQETIFLSVFTGIQDFISEESDYEVNKPDDSGELFSSLQQIDQLNRSRCIELLTQFSFDMLIHIIEEYIDPNWIYQDSISISSKIGKQKEREKQTIIEGLESKTDEHRLVSGFLQNFGIIEGAYKGSEKANLEYIESQVFEQQMQVEVSEAATKLLQVPEEEGYSQYDQDRDDEGLDDNDDDGDYHEN
jgi:hypothetical protein